MSASGPSRVGPKCVGHNAIGAKHDDQTLLAPALIGEAQAGQIQHKRHGRRADAQIAKKFTSAALNHLYSSKDKDPVSIDYTL